MMEYFISNPLSNPLLSPVLLRVLIILFFGFLLTLFLHNGERHDVFRSNVGKRYLGWLIIVPLYLTAIFFGGVVALGLLTIVLLCAVWEFAKITHPGNMLICVLVLFSFLSLGIAVVYPNVFYLLPILYFAGVSLTGIAKNHETNSFKTATTGLYFAMWVIFGICHFVLLAALGAAYHDRGALLLMLGFAIPLGDVCAYVVGNYFRRVGVFQNSIIASALSPKKTYAGTLGNILGAVLGIFIMSFALLTLLPWYHLAILSLIIGVGGVFGDLIESMWKRNAGVKDSGTIVIGHGGILDRVDSMIVATVATYYYLVIFI